MGSLRSLHRHVSLDVLHVEFSHSDERFIKFYSYWYDPADLERRGLKYLGGTRADSRLEESLNSVIKLKKKLNFSFVTLGFSVPLDLLYLLRENGVQTFLWTPDVPLPNFK
jgi:hypothetical protein